MSTHTTLPTLPDMIIHFITVLNPIMNAYFLLIFDYKIKGTVHELFGINLSSSSQPADSYKNHPSDSYKNHPADSYKNDEITQELTFDAFSTTNDTESRQFAPPPNTMDDKNDHTDIIQQNILAIQSYNFNDVSIEWRGESQLDE